MQEVHRFKPSRRWFRCIAVMILAVVTLASTAVATTDTASTSSSTIETFDEHLLVRPLPDGRLQTSFDFRISSLSSSSQHFRLLPRTLIQAISSFDAQELHLSLNTGRWKYDEWGSPVYRFRHNTTKGPWMPTILEAGTESVAPGAELWARFANDISTPPSLSFSFPPLSNQNGPFDPPPQVYQNWRGLTSSLAGLFCASLNALDHRSTVQPIQANFKRNLEYSYLRRPQQQPPPSSSLNSSSTLLHAFLPSEGVCTENLTPFLKLLPCRSAAGLATLLNPEALFGANFQGLAIHVVRKTDQSGWDVRLSFQAVFSPAITRDVSHRDWSFDSIFGQTLKTSCPIATSSTIRLLKPTDSLAQYLVEPLPPLPTDPFDIEDEVDLEMIPLLTLDEIVSWTQQRLQRWRQHLYKLGSYIYDVANVTSNSSFDLSMQWPNETRFNYPLSSPPRHTIQASRRISAYGQQRAKLHVTITNHDISQPQMLTYYDPLAWFLNPFLHTLSSKLTFHPPLSFSSQQQHDDDENGIITRFAQDLRIPSIQSIIYQPLFPFSLELQLYIPPKSTLQLSLDLHRHFLKYSQHSPDAHRGFDLSPSFLSFKSSNGIGRRQFIYLSPLVVELATPDFSFVYTNIIFVSTLIALFFGSCLNAMVRQYRDVLI